MATIRQPGEAVGSGELLELGLARDVARQSLGELVVHALELGHATSLEVDLTSGGLGGEAKLRGMDALVDPGLGEGGPEGEVLA